MGSVPSPAEDLWRGQSLQTRAAERRERLLDAGMELMGSVGAAQVTVRGVCRGAGVGLRYFYESFADADSLLVAVYDRVADALSQQVVNRVGAAPANPKARAQAAFASAVDFIDDDPRRGRILFRETLANDVLREHGAVTVPRFVALVLAALTDARPGEGECRKALQISALSGGLVSLFLDRQAGTLTVPRQELVDYCCELTWAVTGIDPDE